MTVGDYFHSKTTKTQVVKTQGGALITDKKGNRVNVQRPLVVNFVNKIDFLKRCYHY